MNYLYVGDLKEEPNTFRDEHYLVIESTERLIADDHKALYMAHLTSDDLDALKTLVLHGGLWDIQEHNLEFRKNEKTLMILDTEQPDNTQDSMFVDRDPAKLLWNMHAGLEALNKIADTINLPRPSSDDDLEKLMGAFKAARNNNN